MADYSITILPTRQELGSIRAFLMRLASDANLPAKYRIEAIAHSMALAAPAYQGTRDPQFEMADYLDETFRCLIEIVGDPTAPEDIRHYAKSLLQQWKTD
jgi:hypothetical protein